MSWFTDIRDATLQHSGLGTPAQAASTIGNLVRPAVSSSGAQPQAAPAVSAGTHPSEMAAKVGLSAGTILLIGAVVFFVVIRKGRI